MNDNSWKNEVKRRDKYTCRRCGFDKNLEVHHILPQKEFPNYVDNLHNGITLCGNCHSLLKGKETVTDLRGFLPNDNTIEKQFMELHKSIDADLDMLSYEVYQEMKSIVALFHGPEHPITMETYGRIDARLQEKQLSLFAEEYFSSGNTKFKRGKYKSAINDYDNAIRLKTDCADAYFKRGNAKFELKHYKAAIYDYDKAICLKPDYVDAYFNRGLTKINLQQYRSAIVDYDMVLQLDPDYVNACHNRGLAKIELEQYQAAIVDFDIVIDFNLNAPKAYRLRGKAKCQLGQYEDAISDYSEAIRLKPNHAQAYFNRGQIQIQLKHVDEGRQDLKTALKLAKKARDKRLRVEIERCLCELETRKTD
ncbi:MAG: tetratricopeptide repeat protein [Candidatus Poribacteria bacterium]|nr:tetratricopeptide repeat protein [Candidatus Poribacteria bacterium]